MGRVAIRLLLLLMVLPGLLGAGDPPAGQVTPDSEVTFNINEIGMRGRVGMPAHDRPGEPDVTYERPADKDFRLALLSDGMDLDSLISLVSQDSLYAYSVELLEGGTRLAGSGGALRAANWLMEKMTGFGYDSIVVDSFYRTSPYRPDGPPTFCRNILVYKQGSLYPHEHIVLGAHYDTFSGSPGVDDNGSGVAAVLEMARVLSTLDTKTGFTFVFFDGEEEGMLGEDQLAEQVVEAKAKVPYVCELDVIAYLPNDTLAYLGTGKKDLYALMWAQLADSLAGIGITGNIHYAKSYYENLDLLMSNGYACLGVHEDSTSWEHIHTANDNLSNANFDYMTRMTKATLATAYYGSQTFVPSPDLIAEWPEGTPTMISPGTSPILRIFIEEYGGAQIAPGSVQMWYSLNDAPEESIAMTSLGGSVYEAPFPPLTCHDRIDYYVSAVDATTGSTYHLPETPVRAAVATSITICFQDDFEQDLGWTTGGSASGGTWARYPAKYNGFSPKQDYDGSGQCYFTDPLPYNDVDAGTASLFSPWLDVSRGEAILEYAYSFWDRRTSIAPWVPDVFSVYIDKGVESVVLDRIEGPDTIGGWHTNGMWLGEYAHGDSLVRIRFDASDLGFDSEVEAALDAVRIVLYSVRPAIQTDVLAAGEVGIPYAQQLAAMACAEPLVWSDKNGDLTGTGLTLGPDGILTGAPTNTGIITFTAQVTDAEGVTSEREYRIEVTIPFICGDANRDGGVSVGDVVFLVGYIFKGGAAPNPLDIADSDGDGAVTVADVVHMINYIFKGGPPPICG